METFSEAKQVCIKALHALGAGGRANVVGQRPTDCLSVAAFSSSHTHTSLLISLLLGFLLSVGHTSAWGESLRLLVQDQTGQPLPHAVIEIQQPMSARSTPVTAPTEIAVMDQIAKRFVPELLVIQAGQRVEFPNSDNIRHHVYSFSPTKPFELKLYAGHPEQPILFEHSGVVVMGCNIHDTMVGYIYVAASARVAVSDIDGRAELHADAAPKSAITLSLWHAQQSTGPELRGQITLDGSVKRLADGTWVLPLNVSNPAPRDTFEAKFRAVEK